MRLQNLTLLTMRNHFKPNFQSRQAAFFLEV